MTTDIFIGQLLRWNTTESKLLARITRRYFFDKYDHYGIWSIWPYILLQRQEWSLFSSKGDNL